MTLLDPKPFRLLPKLDDLNTPYWTGGEHGELRFWRCQACRYWIHPPSPRCPSCLSKDLAVEAVSGRATVHAYTINEQPWGFPGFDPPYVIAIVELPEQEGLRLTTNIERCAPADVHIGMAVTVAFEHHADVWISVFVPEGVA